MLGTAVEKTAEERGWAGPPQGLPGPPALLLSLPAQPPGQALPSGRRARRGAGCTTSGSREGSGSLGVLQETQLGTGLLQQHHLVLQGCLSVGLTGPRPHACPTAPQVPQL